MNYDPNASGEQKNENPAEPIRKDDLAEEDASGTRDKEAVQILIKHYTDQFWSGLTKTNVALLAWIGAVLLIFVDPILFLPQDAKTQRNVVGDIQRQQLDANKKSEKRILSQASSETSPSAETPPDQASKENANRADTKPQTEQPSRNALEEKKQEATERLSKLRTPFGEISIKAIYAPVLWSFLFVGLLMFFLHKRVVLVATLSKAIDLHMKHRAGKISAVKGLGSWSPFWLAPLPRPAEDSAFSEDVMKQFLGWTSAQKWREKLTWACLLIAHVLYVVVAANSVQLVRFSNNPQLAFALSIVVIGLFISCLLLTRAWFRPHVRFGSFPEEFLPESRGRRRFLVTGVGVAGFSVLSGVVALALPRKPLMVLRIIARYPRFRREMKVPPRYELLNKFVLNPDAKPVAATALPGSRNPTEPSDARGVIHYIGGNGFTSGRVYLNTYRTTRKIISIQDQDVIPVLSQQASSASLMRRRVNAARVGALTECLALSLPIEQRLNILWSGILSDTNLKKKTGRKPNYRLYDLYAGIAYHLKNAAERDKLIAYANEHWSSYSAMSERVKKWANPSEKWKQKWERTPSWKPSIGDPKHPESYNGYCSRIAK